MSSVRSTKTTCCYCGVGCGVIVDTEQRGEQVVVTGVRGDPDHPANLGRLCTKGSTLDLTAQPLIYDQLRARSPEMRTSRAADRHQVSWAEATTHVAERLAHTIETHGPDSVGLYVSGQLLTEDYYVFNKIARGLIGTNNIDTNSRLCMSSAVAGYKQTLGADAPPCSYEDIDHAGTLFIVGSNTAYAHPVLFRRIEAARMANPGMRIVVVDPRRTDTADSADLFLQILPGTDVALFHGMLHLMLWEGWIDQAYIDAHTEGFSELRTLVRDYTPKAVAQICGIREDDLAEAARLFSRSPATLSLYCQGLNQSTSGTAKNAALINLHLATGQIGKPGAGPFSLTGQPNAMGGREVGGLANLLCAHRDLGNPAHRREVADFWGVTDVPAEPGLTAVAMFEALRTGKLRAVWIVCTNPAQSLPDQRLVREALENAEFVVVQDAYRSTATVSYADVLLPAATWAEKEGTVTNSERRISRVRAALPPYAQCRQDWDIALDIARKLEARLARRMTSPARSLFPFFDARSIWEEHRALTKGRDLDITGLTYDILERLGPQQWPYPEGATQGRKRLYEDGTYPTASGRARFQANHYQETAELTDARFPFGLTTGRLRDQWHGMSRTSSLARLFSHSPLPCVEVSGRDLERLGLQAGELAYVTSRRGVQVLPAQMSGRVRDSQAFIAMHWGSEFVSGKAGKHLSHGINSLTQSATDPLSRQPELKFAAVKITRANLPWHLHAFAWVDSAHALTAQLRLRALFSEATYAAATLFGHDAPAGRTGLHLRLANTEPFSAGILASASDAMGLTACHEAGRVLSFHDKRRSAQRHLAVESAGGRSTLAAVLLAGGPADVQASDWLRDMLEQGTDIAPLGSRILTPSRQAPLALAPRGTIVCNCFGVTSASIGQFLAQTGEAPPDTMFALMQKSLQCGTNCGSCLPEVRQLIKAHGH